MRRLLLAFVLITMLTVVPMLFHPQSAIAAYTTAAIPALSYSWCPNNAGDGGTHHNDGSNQNTISGHTITDTGDSCYGFDPSTSYCSGLCWDVQAGTSISYSVYQSYAAAYGWDKCGSGAYVYEMGVDNWANGSSSITPMNSSAYGNYQSCGSSGHQYWGNYIHNFQYSSSSSPATSFSANWYD